ncbi:MAG: orotidine 5'-phosphate decarboxylase / HUMPS family protein [Acidilobaceae archaeon]
MRESRLIVALDPERGVSLEPLLPIVSAVCSEVYGLKIGLPFMVLYGIQGLRSLRRACRARVIADFKLADVAHVMVRSVEPIAEFVDAVIAHAFVGRAGALDELKAFLDSKGIDLALVVSMSHPGSSEIIDENIEKTLAVAEALKPWGLVAPATRPAMIRVARSRLPAARILSPGIGAQGARPGDALRAGADYEIVGRSIWGSRDPLEAVRFINLEHERALRGELE